MEIHRSARRHGVRDADIVHALGRVAVECEIGDGDGDSPRRLLVLGPDRAGNMLELVVLVFDDGRQMVIHAMVMRAKYRALLPKEA
ncbi:MAG: hypothetical protein F2681_16695 [Actinobacteria bacterium]|nr:hypothetical protein [Actinomycetota bacterium]MSW79117.1 hypothetical protein [Actinomycetota bacterium]MSX56117.1 hypothetical protein [Actinomycetota bacterium]MSX93850.1 hypothetical protein [Actinomycetota bacterium]MSZ84771.1 hypothetical protein [Actinomycetota bacterium]